MKNLLIIVIYAVTLQVSFSQNIDEKPQYDSLIRVNRLVTGDTNQVNVWNELAGFKVFSRPDSGIYYATNALSLSRSISFVRGELFALQLLSLSHSTLGNYSKALRIDLEGLRKVEESDEKDFMGKFLINLGTDYYNTGNYKNSLRYYQNGYSLFNAAGDSNFSAISGASLGRTYFALDQVDSAFQICYVARRLGESTKLDWVMTVTYRHLGSIYSSIDSTDSALFYLKKSYTLSEGRESFTSATGLKIARIFQKTGQMDSSLVYAEDALQIAIENKLYTNIINASLFFSAFYEQSDAAKALSYHKTALAYSDSLSNMSKMISFTDFKDFDVQQREYELENARKESQSRIRLNTMIGSTFTLVLIAFFLFRNNRNKQQAKQKIEKSYEELKSTQTQLIHSEKMASLGELTAGIAHEIQNPLNFVNNFSDVNSELAEELREEIDKGNIEEAKAIAKDIKDNEQKIVHHGKRAEEIVKSMLQHSRGSDGKKEPTDINMLADEYLRLAFHGMRAKDRSFNATMDTDFDPEIDKINIVPQDIGRVILNLITNAFYACTERSRSAVSAKVGGDYKPVVKVTTKKLKDAVEIKVADNGTGIPQDIINKIFEPFFSTKSTGHGTGLGLSLSYDIITKGHGGTIKVESTVIGTEFIIVIPIK